ncbi:MAG: secretin and TonB N-terminal domain-containing protein [bacterium]|jgi:general secretion pathway protein D
MVKRHLRKISVSFLIGAFLVAGCASEHAFTKGGEAAQKGDWDQAVLSYEQAYKEDPGNKDYKIELRRARFEAAKDHLKRGNRYLDEKEFDRAIEEFRRALSFEPTFATAQNAYTTATILKEAQRAHESGLSLLRAGKDEEAKEAFARAVELNPAHLEAAEQLKAMARRSRKPVIGQFEIQLKSTKPISIKLTDTSIREAFSILSKLSGVNFLFDEDVRDRKVSVSLENVRFEQALDLLTTLANLSKKVLSENTIIFYPNTPAKQSQYQDQFVRTFFLSNVDAKKMVNLIRSIVQVKKIFVNEELNAIVVRDDPETIAVIGKILDANDITDSELMLDVEILEVDRNKLLNLGVQLVPTSAGVALSESTSTTGTPATGTPTPSGNRISLSTLRNLSGKNVLFTLPSAILNLKSETSGAEILANPKIRVKNHGKARIHIGERVPIITTSTNLGVITESIQYQDVGVKLDVDPWIHHNNEVTLKVKLEVSTLGAQVQGAQTVAFRIGTRTTESELRLHDRETQIIGGLISDEERNTVTRIPGLGDIPVLGYLFSSHDKTKVKTDILMSITPYLLRTTAVPSRDAMSVYSGRENAVSSQRPSWDSRGGERVEGSTEPPPVPSAPGAGPMDLPGSSAAPPSVPSPAVNPSPAVSPDPASVALRGAREVALGDGFDVDVVVDGVRGLYAVPLTVLFDPARLKVLSVTEGDFLRKGGNATSFMSSPDAANGKIVIGLSRQGDLPGEDGSGRLLTIRFQAAARGAAPVRLGGVSLRDPARRSIPVRTADLPLEIR